MAAAQLSYCAGLIRRQDPDRYLTALFAPADRREALLALYALNLELARARENVREPIMGQMRLQWWREGLAEMRTGRPRAHEVIQALSAANAARRLTPALLDALIDARERDMDPAPPADLAELIAYAEGTSSNLVELALEVLGEPSPAERAAGRTIGIAWALVGLLRAVPFHAAQRRIYLPASLGAAAGLDVDQLFERGTSPALRMVVRSIAAEAKSRLAEARRTQADVSRQFLPALLPGVLADGHLSRLAAASYDPFDAGVQAPPPGRVWHLGLRWLLGRY